MSNQSQSIFPTEAGGKQPVTKTRRTSHTSRDHTSRQSESASQTAYSQVPENSGPSRCKPSEQPGSEQSKTETVPKQTTGPVPISCTLQHTISTASKDKNLAPGDDFRDGNPANSDIGNGRGSRTRVAGDPFSLVTLNVKNMKTNMGYLKCLAKTHPIILVQEHWLYGFETVIAQQVFDNSNYHIKCVDDLDPSLPYSLREDALEQPYSEINPLITVLPHSRMEVAVLLQWRLMSSPGRSVLSMFTFQQEAPPTVTLPSKQRWMKFTKSWKSLLPHTRYY